MQHFPHGLFERKLKQTIYYLCYLPFGL